MQVQQLMPMDTEELTENAFKYMLKRFSIWPHDPSPEMLQGLWNLQDTLTRMLEGTCEDVFYLSSLDPGVGKTTAILSWLDSFLVDPEAYGDEGVLIGLERLEEISVYIKKAGIPADSFAVLVSDNTEGGPALNATGLGSGQINDARILFTTKAQILLRTSGKSFNEVSSLFYKGRPRRVRIWDESLSVGKGITLERYDLTLILKDLNRRCPNLASAVEQVSMDLKSAEDAAVYQMPDLDVSLNELLHSFAWNSLDKRTAAESLGLLAGRAVTVRREERGQVLVDCIESLPEDFKPCLVTDASGRIRETYNLQHEYRQDLVRLAPVASCKRYDALTVHVWRKGSGKQAYRNEGVEGFAEEVAKAVLAKPGEDFLVIRAKDHSALEGAILKRLSDPDKGRVRFLTWGKHTATNDHAEVPNVILTSILHYRVSDYEADARASASLPTSKGNLSPDELNAYRRGEHAHHLLQAICRCRVRQAVGDGCPTSDVWIITPPQTGIEGMLPRIFPGCTVQTWKTRPVPLSGVRKGALEFILESLTGKVDAVAGSKVRKHIGLDQSNFRRDVLASEDFLDALAGHGIALDQRGQRYFFQRCPFSVEGEKVVNVL